ncbi:helicase associated domain-containing protein [Streptomyces avermitilis]|uniref:helicase associated domain-containing protein n=1 Tax=Streptomyces avermitilis TaxID=33903 RepID=UPI0033AF50D1
MNIYAGRRSRGRHRGRNRQRKANGLTTLIPERAPAQSGAWPRRRRPAADGLATARTYAERHGHLAVPRPTTVDGFALGTWLIISAGVSTASPGSPGWDTV